MASPDGDDQSFWAAEKMLDLYLHDYMVKKNLHETAAIFRREANVDAVPVAIDSFDGFLKEWWSVFYDIYASRQLKHQEAQENSFVQAGQVMHNEGQNIHQTMAPLLANNQQQSPGQFAVGPDHNKMSSIMPARMSDQQQHLRRPISCNLNPSLVQHKIKNQDQQLIVANRNGNSIAGSNPRDITLTGAQRGSFPAVRSSSGAGVIPLPSNGCLSNSLMQTPNRAAQQFSILTGQPLSLAPANFYGRGLILPKINLSGKDAQMMVQMKQSAEHSQQNLLMQNGRKRRKLPRSRAGEGTLCGADAEVNKPVDEVESFLSTDDDKDDNESAHGSAACSKTNDKGFTFQEIGSLRSSKTKVLCCQFSSDGKLLASGGHDKKVFIWNMENFNFADSSDGHTSLITDVRFKTNSSIIATSSFDRTLQIWDAAKPTKSLLKLIGHTEQVMALDFHPKKADHLCSCDNNDEIRLWNVNCGACIKVSKGATKQVRFQPQYGNLLATASGKSINVIDVEKDSRVQFNLKGHAKEVLSLCWDPSGNYIASVSEDSARVWSLASGGNCMHELHSDGNKFRSCAFHPLHSQVLMVGGYQSIELWNLLEGNETRSVSAHSGLISALAGSLENEMIASASHDRCVKLWK